MIQSVNAKNSINFNHTVNSKPNYDISRSNYFIADHFSSKMGASEAHSRLEFKFLKRKNWTKKTEENIQNGKKEKGRRKIAVVLKANMVFLPSDNECNKKVLNK